jgi:hypothetical protein
MPIDPAIEEDDDPMFSARTAVADLLTKALIATGEKPSPAHVAFLREAVEDELRYEATVQRRINQLMDPDPGHLPAPSIRRVTRREEVVDRALIADR